MRKEIIGNCTLYLADCSKIIDKLTHADVVITDPPYEITGKGGGIGAKRDYLKDITSENLELGFDMSILDLFKRWAAFGTKRQIVPLINKAEEQKKNWALLTWNKPNPTPLTNNNYLPDTEYLVHAFDSGGIYGGYADKARFIVHNAGGKEFDHPTVKPLPVMQKIIRTASDVGQLVIDPFMGTGTTGVACIKEGRRFIGIEVSEKFFDIACKRISDAVNQPDMFAPAPEKMTQGVFI